MSAVSLELIDVTATEQVLEPPASPDDRVTLGRRGLAIDELVRVARARAHFEVDDEVRATVARSRGVVERALERGAPIYGLNTHLGHRRNETVARDQLGEYQAFVLTTHSAGIGEPLPEEKVRAVMAARIAGLARGGAGISPRVFDTLVEMLDRGVHPLIPSVGSIGAADLTQLAAVAEVLTGTGLAIHGPFRLSGASAMRRAGVHPAQLEPKDALALVSSNAVSIGLGALAVHDVGYLADLADIAGALTLEATQGNLSPFGATVAASKGGTLSGQVESAAHLRSLLAGSRLETEGRARDVQDALSLRTLPQVHGALRDQLAFAKAALETELNAASDNPLVSVEEDRLISNGNFSPMTLALSFESLRLALAHVGALCERRLHKLLVVRHRQQAKLEPLELLGRVPNLVVNAAAGLLAQLKHLAQPVTLATTSLNCDVEDHASLAPQAVTLTSQAVGLLEQLLGLELLLAADTVEIELQSGPVRLGTGTAEALTRVQAAQRITDTTSTALAEVVRSFRESAS